MRTFFFRGMLAVVFKVFLDEFCSIQKQSRTGHQLFPADAFLKSSNLSRYHGKPFRKNRSLFSLCCACVRGAPQPRHTTRKAVVCDCGCLTCAFAEHLLADPRAPWVSGRKIPNPMHATPGDAAVKSEICADLHSWFVVRCLCNYSPSLLVGHF